MVQANSRKIMVRPELGLHVKMSENYFQILEVGKNVGKFLFRRSVKMSENDLAEVQKCRKIDQKFFRIKMNSYFKKMIFQSLVKLDTLISMSFSKF